MKKNEKETQSQTKNRIKIRLTNVQHVQIENQPKIVCWHL